MHLVGFTELLRIMWRFHEQVYSDPKAPTGLNKVGVFLLECATKLMRGYCARIAILER